MEKSNSTDAGGAGLSTEEYLKLYGAAVMGEPDPIGSEASKVEYEKLKAAIEANPDAQWDVPGEIPDVDPPENAKDNAGPE